MENRGELTHVRAGLKHVTHALVIARNSVVRSVLCGNREKVKDDKIILCGDQSNVISLEVKAKGTRVAKGHSRRQKGRSWAFGSTKLKTSL